MRLVLWLGIVALAACARHPRTDPGLAGQAPAGREQGQPAGQLLFAISPPLWFEGFGTSALISPDGRLAIYGLSAAGVPRIIDLITGRETTEPLWPGLSAVYAAAFGPRGVLALAGTRDNENGWFLPSAEGPRRVPLPASAVPHWSPFDDRVAYFLRRSPDQGVTVMEAGAERRFPVDGRIAGMAWAPDGTVLVLAHDSLGVGSLSRINVETGRVETRVTDLDVVPSSSPAALAVASDGRHVYVPVATPGVPDPAERHRPKADRFLGIYEIDLETGTRRRVVGSGADHFAPAVARSHLYWTTAALRQSIVVVPIAGGPARVVLEDAQLPTWRPDGRMLGLTTGDWRLADWALNLDGAGVEVDSVVRPTGAAQALITGYHEDFSPVWSPDGRWIAYHSHRSAAPMVQYGASGGTDDIYLRRPDTAGEIRLTDFGWEVGSPDWAPDSRRLVFTSWQRTVNKSVAWITTIDGETGRATDHRKLELPSGSIADAAWSPAGDVIAVTEVLPRGRRALWTVRPDGSELQRLAEYAMFTYGGIDWTPDGRTLIFSAIHEDRMQLFSVSAAGGEPRRLTLDEAQLLHPQVSPDGRWIAATRLVQRREIRRLRLP